MESPYVSSVFTEVLLEGRLIVGLFGISGELDVRIFDLRLVSEFAPPTILLLYHRHHEG